MLTHFLAFELDLAAPAELHRLILSRLEQDGEPLRWAIVAVDADRHKVQVEAVLTSTELLTRIDSHVITV
jgi:hypothetical protein